MTRSNLDAEESVLGAALVDRNVVRRLAGELQAGDFARPSHGLIWAAILALHNEGSAVDHVTVADKLGPELETIGGSSALAVLMASVPASSHAPTYATTIRREAAARRLWGYGLDVVKAISEDNADPYEVADDLEANLARLDRAGSMPERYWKTTADYLAADKGDHAEPVVKDFIPAMSRTFVLATEKAGKSTWLRQVADCVAGGVHPITFEDIPEVPTLILDAENDDDELERMLPLLEDMLDKVVGPERGRPALFSAPYGLDLRSRRDRSQLEEVMEDCRPKLVIGGPIYKLIDRRERESEDDRSGALIKVFNDMRRRYGCALMLEHHAPTGGRDGVREMRSKGGQQWDAWVSATMALYARDGGAKLVVKYAHPPRGRIIWPKALIRGTRPGEWPWMPTSARESDDPPPRDEPEQERIF